MSNPARNHETCGGRIRRFQVFFICLLAAGVATVSGQELPQANELLDKYIQVTGGKEAYSKIRNRVTKAQLEFVGQGLKMSLTVYAARPNLVYSVLESEAIGKVESGTDGAVVWENSLLKGPAIKQGVERENALRDFTFDRLANWNQIYKDVKCVAKLSVDGKPCFKIVMTPKRPKAAKTDAKDSSLTVYVDERSHLVTKIESRRHRSWQDPRHGVAG